VHRQIAERLLPRLQKALEAKAVQIRGCHETVDIIDVKPAAEEDWGTEYLDLIVAVKVVPDLESAIAHINRYGSGHTDAIVTNDKARALRFMNLVDSADVFCNCSTRFSDGFRYGLGAEVGISTNKIHARGPVGLEGLVIYQWRLLGQGQVVGDYTGPQGRSFSHRSLNKPFPL
jgi:glutamate-5-semialdehyde dehydrogenase